MPPSKEEIPFSWSCSWGRAFFHAIWNYMTWLNFIKYKHTHLIYYFGHLELLWQLPQLNSLQSSWPSSLLFHHTIIPWIPYKVEFLARHLLLSVGEPSNEDSKGGSWSSSSCKCSFSIMYDELYTTWLSSSHKYYLCF